MSLHDEIMRIPCDPKRSPCRGVSAELAYKSGHRDARHAAAELAAAAEQPEAPGLPELLIALGCAGIAVSGGTHGDPWRLTLPIAEHPDTVPVPRELLEYITTMGWLTQESWRKLNALLGKESE